MKIEPNMNVYSAPNSHKAEAARTTRFAVVSLILLGLMVIVGEASGQAQSQSVVTQQPPTPCAKCVATDLENANIRIAQLEALNAYDAWSSASLKLAEYAQFQAKQAAAFQACAKVVSEHKWASNVTCNLSAQPPVWVEISTGVVGAAGATGTPAGAVDVPVPAKKDAPAASKDKDKK